MEIRRWHFYIIFNCVIICYSEAKTFSINEAIAAESQQKKLLEIPQRKLSESANRRHTTKQPLKLKIHELGKRENTLPRSQKISPLKYRKTFQINSPLKPKKNKIPYPLRNKRKNQSVKREISGNEKLKEKYIPLLKSLSMLFDNLLNSDGSESLELKSKNHKRSRYYSYSEEKSGEGCACNSDSKTYDSRPQEKTTTTPQITSTEISIVTEASTAETSTAATDTSTSAHIRTFGTNKKLSILLPRNTLSTRRDNNGIGKGGGASHNRNTEGNISGAHGNREHNTGCGENEFDTKSDEKNTCSPSRDDASSNGSPARESILGDRNDTRNSEDRTAADEVTISEDESAENDFGENKFEIRRNKTKSSESISEPIRRLRGFVPKPKVSDIQECIQPQEIREESNVNVRLDSTDDKRVVSGSSATSGEVEEFRSGNETVASQRSHLLNHRSPVLMIFDGYSVTRDKNGENKLAGKAIRIQS